MCALVLDFSVILGWRCSESRSCCGPPPCTSLPSCSPRDSAEEVSQKRNKKCYSTCAAAVQALRPRAAALSNAWVFWCRHWCLGEGNACSLTYSFLLEKWLISSWNCSDAKWWLPEKASFINCGWVIGEGGEDLFSPP